MTPSSALAPWLLCAALLAAISCLIVPARAADDKSGVSPSRLHLPKGPGSLEGIGENAEPNLSMGLMTYGVPIEVPKGYDGLAPALRLAYSSGSGNSEVGIGWSLSVPSVERMTSKGLPRYAVTDTFAANGGDELVRLGNSSVYRARYEGGFVRYTWRNSGDGKQGFWTAEYPDGRIGTFGARADGASDESALVRGPLGVFRYHLSEMTDRLGHSVRYEYAKDGSVSLPHRISYGFQGPGNTLPRYVVLFAYEERPDAISDARPGIDVRLSRRLTSIQVLVRGAQLRRYVLSYRAPTARTFLSRLERVAQFGLLDKGPYPIDFRFSYTGEAEPNCSGPSCDSPTLVDVSGELGLDFATGQADLTDINGDGLPDVLDTSQAKHRFFVNTLDAQGRPSFGSPVASSVGSLSLTAPDVQTVDIDGDGFSDLVKTDVGNGAARVLWNKGAGQWHADAIVNGLGLPNFSQASNLRFVDYNGDKRIDLLFSDGASSFVYENTPGPSGSPRFQHRVLENLGVALSAAQLSDMNGDGLQDVVRVATGLVAYRLSLGWGNWSEWLEMDNPPEVDGAGAKLVDINGDGLSDVVLVQGDKVRYRLNQNGRVFGSEVSLAAPSMPSGASLRFADLNGNGSTDVVWLTPSGKVSLLELFPRRPNLLRTITTGIGKVIDVTYGSSVAHMALDASQDKPWAHRLPNPTLTVDEIATSDTLTGVRQVRRFRYRDGYYDGEERQFRGFESVTVQTPGDGTVESGTTVHDFDVGRQDRYHKALLLRQTTSSARRTLKVDDKAYVDCVVAGVPSGTEPPVRYVCMASSQSTPQEGLSAGQWVVTREAYEYDGWGNQTLVEKHGVVSIGGGACGACNRADDVMGAPCGPRCLGDESFEETEFIVPLAEQSPWILHKPRVKRSWGAQSSAHARETRFYYDGQPFQGLPVGQLTKGLPTRTEELLDGTTYVQKERVRWDAHGNPAETIDPEDHRRLFAYDPAGLLLVSEKVVFQNYALGMTASYDTVHEKIVEASSWMRYEGANAVSAPRSTRFSYDAFGRITAIARPGDPLEAPTETFVYELANPVSRIRRMARSRVAGPIDVEEVQCFDGLGRKYETRALVSSHQFQVTGYTAYDAQGGARDAFQPFVSEGRACDRTPPSNVLFAQTSYDAIKRPLRVQHPDGALYRGKPSETRTEYRPLQALAYDEEDSDPSSPYAGTPLVTTTDGLGRTTAYDRKLASDHAIHLELTYDEWGNLRGYVDARGNEKVQKYDRLGRVIQVDDPDAHTTTFVYDRAGNKLRQTDARGVVTEYRYDEANRIREEWDAADRPGTLVSYAYDRLDGCPATECSNLEGNLARISYPMDKEPGRDQMGYDFRGQAVRLSRTMDGHEFVVGTEYDNLGRVTGATYPMGYRLSYQQDGLGRVAAIPGHVPDVRYDERGLTASFRLANGVETAYLYDARLRLQSLRTMGPSGKVLQDYTYTRDRVGNILKIDDASELGGSPSGAAEYRYDGLYRLTSAKLDPGRTAAEALSFAYDDLDNILSKTSEQGAKSKDHVGAYTYGENGAGPHAVTKAGELSLRYDPAGNVTQRGTDAYVWDHQGRMSEAKRGAENLGKFTYGAARDRVKKTEGGKVTYFVSPDFEVRDGVGIVYVRLGDRKVAKIELRQMAAEVLPDLAPVSLDGASAVCRPDGNIRASDGWIAQASASGALSLSPRYTEEDAAQLLASSARLGLTRAAGQVTYLHHNHLGTTVLSTDGLGAVVQRTEYYPYGLVRHSSGGMPEDYGYTGKELDERSGLTYFGARYLDAWLGRWVSMDPIGKLLSQDSMKQPFEVTMGRYCVTQLSPVNKTDVDGRATFWGSVGAAAGSAGIAVISTLSAVGHESAFFIKGSFAMVASGLGATSIAKRFAESALVHNATAECDMAIAGKAAQDVAAPYNHAEREVDRAKAVYEFARSPSLEGAGTVLGQEAENSLLSTQDKGVTDVAQGNATAVYGGGQISHGDVSNGVKNVREGVAQSEEGQTAALSDLEVSNR